MRITSALVAAIVAVTSTSNAVSLPDDGDDMEIWEIWSKKNEEAMQQLISDAQRLKNTGLLPYEDIEYVLSDLISMQPEIVVTREKDEALRDTLLMLKRIFSKDPTEEEAEELKEQFWTAEEILRKLLTSTN